jgi:steroid 5-alpha reductase family enzyme
LWSDRVGKPEDGRYATLRAAWGEQAQPKFLAFYAAQAVLAVLLATPFLLAVGNTGSSAHWTEVLGCAIVAIAVVGESTADAQLARFKRRPESKGKTCREGLWRYSRHPNYFFEWSAWLGFALLATSTPYGWIAWFAPAVMLYLLFKVTGIPATEAQALRSRGADYREYQRTTSVFVPWFPRN